MIGGGCRDSSDEREEFDYLFAAPETLVGDQHWRSKKKLKKSIELVNTSNTINYNCRRASMLAPFHTIAELSQMKEVEPVTFVIPVVICVIRFVNVDSNTY